MLKYVANCSKPMSFKTHAYFPQFNMSRAYFRNSICPVQTANRWTCPSRQNYGKKYVIMGTKGLEISHDRPTKPADCNRFSSIILSNAVNNSSSLCLVNECFKPHFLDLSRKNPRQTATWINGLQCWLLVSQC